MALISEKVVVTAKGFLERSNFNDNREFNEPIYQVKLSHFNWELKFAAASIFCEVVWKISVGKGSLTEWQELDRIFTPSPFGTYANFMGNSNYKKGNRPEEGALAFWKKGNSWQAHMAVVTGVSEDGNSFDTVEARALIGSEDKFLDISERLGKRVKLPFAVDKLNLLGFVYPKNREI
jgi:hypothetical protein